MKKILIITYYWPPSGGAGVQRWLKFTKYLPECGIQPFVLTVDPADASYAQLDESLEQEVPESVLVCRSKTFEFYNLYKRLTGRKEIPSGGFAGEGNQSFSQWLAKIIRSNFFIPDPRRGWNRFAYKKAVELIREHQIEIVVTTSPPHSTQLIGLKLKKKLNVRWIADLRDPWTDIYYYRELHHSLLAKKIDRTLELKVLRNADQLITVSQDLKRIFAEKLNKGAEAKISVVPNGYDEDDFEQKVRTEGDRFVVTYTGTISDAYDMNGFLDALGQLDEAMLQKLLLRFVGRISSEIVEKIRQKAPAVELDLVGYVDHKTSVGYLLSSSLQLLIIPRIANNRGIVTGKFYEYLASGKPVLAIGPHNGDLEQLIEETRCGKLFGYDDAVAIHSYLQAGFSGEIDSPVRDKACSYSRKELTRKLASLISCSELNRDQKYIDDPQLNRK